ncbi:cyclase family protein [Aliiroseovarius crassostreae]|uniref:Cyclase family protein n=1 Tax=Aliiroseovarius crassostreae TaxID=154981 RepID=A0A9Q9LUY1_9RHOB|nr:cyclase family protein [Aliiroseovarius crassostreae]UWP95326.1 cyclase family protein [Aliiroseovarius crassostreae]
MCDLCIINSVKNRMISRRSFFSSAAALGAAAAVGASQTTPAMAEGHASVQDMTYELSEEFPTYFGTPGISSEAMFNFAEHGFNVSRLTLNEHTGTHIDAPLHFSADGAAVNEIPVSQLIAPLCVVDIATRAAENADTSVTPDDIKAWIAAHGPIPDGACVAMHSGWGTHVATDKYRGADDNGVQHYPGFHVEATQMLLEETKAASLASDTLSIDIGASTTFDTHYAWLPAGRFCIENIANLDLVPPAGATLVIGAPTHRGGSGGPARIFAML